MVFCSSERRKGKVGKFCNLSTRCASQIWKWLELYYFTSAKGIFKIEAEAAFCQIGKCFSSLISSNVGSIITINWDEKERRYS